MPSWLKGDVLDVRKVVSVWAAMNRASDSQQINTKVCPELLFDDRLSFSSYWQFPTSYHFRSLNITHQLRALRLGPFQGRLHCGIDVSIDHTASFVRSSC